MAEWVKVANTGSELALVGDKYLFPGERREVLREHFEAAKERYPQVVELGGAEVKAKAEEDPFAKEKAAIAAQPFAGQAFVLAGSFEVGRTVLVEGIQLLGGTVETELTGQVHYLVAGASPGRKVGQAEKLGVPVITEQELQRMGEG
ncbi:MAG: hypothetical protein KJ077_08110 [Anaerolineae bacterium]|nr:hypothetical protein [Anaerolineae bacterium]